MMKPSTGNGNESHQPSAIVRMVATVINHILATMAFCVACAAMW
jgi:hypothetical protein